jgi:hypothetical protein
MSLCMTCKYVGVEPFAYPRDVLDRVSTHSASRIEELLPDRWQALRQVGDAGTDRTPLSPSLVIHPGRAFEG